MFCTELGSRLYERIKKGGLQQRTNLADIADLEFPLPDEDHIEQLVAVMNAGLAERRAKLEMADTLLKGMNGFVQNTLDLAIPPEDKRMAFATSKVELGRQARLNADYFHPERTRMLRALKHGKSTLPSVRLEQVIDFIRDQVKTPGSNYLSLANVQSNTGELVPTDENVTGICSLFQKDDVLFARLRPYLNKVHLAESDGCCSPEFHVLRVKDNEATRPAYLAAVLRSGITLAQTRHMMTGNTHPRLANDDVVNLVIPVPNPSVQETIAEEDHRRREEARRLRVEAEEGWSAARKWFEEQLLGSEQP